MVTSASSLALGAESAAMVDALRALSESDWDRPTRCEPWTVRQLVGHVVVVLSRVGPMVESAPPSGVPVTAAAYYRPDHRFSSDANRQRLQAGSDVAAEAGTGSRLIDALDRVTTSLERIGRREDPARLVRTRHADVMTLDEFLVTRTVEVVLHGIDVADAVERAPWTTSTAGELVLRLLAGDAVEQLRALPWDTPTILRSATGRSDHDGPWDDLLDQLGVTWLALG